MLLTNTGHSGVNLSYGAGYKNGANGALSRNVGFGSTNSFHYLARAYTQTGGSIVGNKITDHAFINSTNDAMGAGKIPYPHASDSGLYVSPVRMAEQSIVRGIIPGIYANLHTTMPHVRHELVVDGAGLSGRTLLAVPISMGWQWGSNGMTYFDITGPWY